MPISILIVTAVLLGAASLIWYVVRDVRGALGTTGRALSVVGFVAAAILFLGAATAPFYEGRPFGLESLKRPYDSWIERFERPMQPWVPEAASRSKPIGP